MTKPKKPRAKKADAAPSNKIFALPPLPEYKEEWVKTEVVLNNSTSFTLTIRDHDFNSLRRDMGNYLDKGQGSSLVILVDNNGVTIVLPFRNIWYISAIPTDKPENSEGRLLN